MYQIHKTKEGVLEVWENGVNVGLFATYKAARDFIHANMLVLDGDE
jgi:hypothetical protein